ncbi:MAG: SHOCT domain-containing protein [Candidatus Thermoplasmatota archaeon]|nr:SHOCT domain-containing protein [Candidatus Thermoplasmatota archaeon]
MDRIPLSGMTLAVIISTILILTVISVHASASQVGEAGPSRVERGTGPEPYRAIVGIPTGSQDQETEEGTDWTGILCCMFMLALVVGIPIILIIIITRAFKSSKDKKKPRSIWTSGPGSGSEGTNTPSVRIDIGPSQGIAVDAIPLDEEVDREEEETVPDLDRATEDSEPDMPSFERPKALSGEEKDEFIVDRIMELKEMLADGEIDREMYENLRKRLVEQLDGRSLPDDI